MRNALAVATLYLMALLLYVLSRMYGGFGPWFLFGAAICLVIYETGALFSLRRRFKITRKLSVSRLRAGEDLNVTLHLQILDRRVLPIGWLRVEDQLPQKLAVRKDQPFVTVYPWRKEAVTVKYGLKNVSRGVYRLDRCVVSGGDMFGLLTKRISVQAEGQLIAYPHTRRVAHWSALDNSKLGNRVSQARSSDDATRVIGTRDYVPGDRLSRIHWPATARTGQLRSKEFEHYVMNELVFIIDAAKLSYAADIASFELALSLVGSLAEYVHKSNLGFGHYAFAEPMVQLPVRKGDVGFMRLMEYLAMAEPDGVESLEKSLWRLVALPAQTTAALVTRSISTELLRFAVMSHDRQMRVELFITRAEPRGLTVEEQVNSLQLRSYGWQIHLIHALEEIERFDTRRARNAYRA